MKTVTVTDTYWMLDASCSGMEVDLFFQLTKPAQAVLDLCAGCPVKVECLAQAMEEEKTGYFRYGVRGGLLPGQRRQLQKGIAS